MRKFKGTLILILVLSMAGHASTNKSTHSEPEDNEPKSWLYSYLKENKEEKNKVSDMIRSIHQGDVNNKMIMEFKNSPPLVRVFILSTMLANNTKTFYYLISTGKNNWMCDTLIEDIPDQEYLYPIFVPNSNDEYLDNIVDYCITSENTKTWSDFVVKNEPKLNHLAKPTFDKIRKEISIKSKRKGY